MESHPDRADVVLCPPSLARDVQAIEHHVGSPLPADLRLVLGRFNGGKTPGGTLLTAAPGAGTTVEAVLREVAAQRQASFLDPDALLPFFRTEQGSILAFDRSAAPVADAWPVVDYDPSSGDVHLVHRTFDGWCRLCVEEWSTEQDGAFDLDRYLRQGMRHVAIEPDVSIAHVTLAHALRRAGRPDDALASYRRGARAIPAIPWADWEALKLGALLDDVAAVEESAARLSQRTPRGRWEARGTTPSRVAYVIARVGARHRRAQAGDPLARALEHLTACTFDAEDDLARQAIATAVAAGMPIPLPVPAQPHAVSTASAVGTEGDDATRLWQRLAQAYSEGRLRDDDLALDPSYDGVRAGRDVREILGIRREF